MNATVLRAYLCGPTSQPKILICKLLQARNATLKLVSLPAGLPVGAYLTTENPDLQAMVVTVKLVSFPAGLHVRAYLTIGNPDLQATASYECYREACGPS